MCFFIAGCEVPPGDEVKDVWNVGKGMDDYLVVSRFGKCSSEDSEVVL